MKFAKIVVLFTWLLVFSCEKKVENAPIKKEATMIQITDGKEIGLEQAKPEAVIEAEKDESFVVLKYSSKARPESVKFPGKAKHGLHWKDRNGDNWFIFSSSRAKHNNGHLQVENLYGTHVAIKEGEAKTLRKVEEIKPTCEFDWNASFEHRAVSVLDLDKDGYGEVTFGYRVACTSDVSPNTYKLMVLENGEKHIFRGSDIINMGGEVIGEGKYKMEGFENEAVLRKHLEGVWKKTVKVTL